MFAFLTDKNGAKRFVFFFSVLCFKYVSLIVYKYPANALGCSCCSFLVLHCIYLFILLCRKPRLPPTLHPHKHLTGISICWCISTLAISLLAHVCPQRSISLLLVCVFLEDLFLFTHEHLGSPLLQIVGFAETHLWGFLLAYWKAIWPFNWPILLARIYEMLLLYQPTKNSYWLKRRHIYFLGHMVNCVLAPELPSWNDTHYFHSHFIAIASSMAIVNVQKVW